ncbi:MAG: NAD-dependent protein deacylase [Propionibacteriaceae bacterium]|jgi:NAD-dependent deacetylase|nr:NAD-dependent protein deacylase [Propionibacteriaceae bacterium]
MDSKLADIIAASRRIVFFGGAGVSTESGIPDFRSAGGLYNQSAGIDYAPEEIISHSFFVQHTADFYDYYRKNLIYPEAKPNAAHLGLAALERAGKVSAVVTQNIDGLHQLAGSRRVLELHGSVLRNFCTKCGKAFGVETILRADGIPYCDGCGGLIKPDVVLYEEPLNGQVMEESVAEIAQADTLIVGGTSLVVYPAAGLVHSFRGKNIVLINKQATGFDSRATLTIREPIGEALAGFVAYDSTAQPHRSDD